MFLKTQMLLKRKEEKIVYNTERTSRVKRAILTVLIVACLIAVIGGTYARYTSTGAGTATVEVAKWAIKINNTDITPTGDTSFTITFKEVPNNNIVDGKIAPSGELFADFIVDPAESEVAVDYSFALGQITSSDGTVPTGLAVKKVVPVTGATISGNTVTGGTEGTALTANGSGDYVGTISLVDQEAALTSSEAQVVRVYIAWTNDDATASNTSHTASGISAPNITMTVTGTAKQHID